MKMNSRIIGVLALFATSCLQEEMTDTIEVRDMSEFVAEAEVFDLGIKTSLIDYSIVWSQSDMLAIFQGSSMADKYRVDDGSVGSTVAKFSYVAENDGATGGGFTGGTEILYDANVAVYPYDDDLMCSCITSGDNMAFAIQNVTIPTVQYYSPNSFPEGAFAMVAATCNVSEHNLQFKNICGALKLQLKGVDKVACISLKGNAEERLSGNATVTAYADGSTPEISMGDDAETYVTLDCGEGVQLSEETTTSFIIAVPPVEFTDGFTVTITFTSGLTKELSTTKGNPVKRSRILRMPEQSIYGCFEGKDAPELKGYTDLSMEGTANSYIVSEPGKYCFSMTKGNSKIQVGAVEEVIVLWCSYMSSDIIVGHYDFITWEGVNIYKNYASFETSDSFKEGNVLLAARDAEDNILWSWHIWFTDEPESFQLSNSLHPIPAIMDRNLGALSSSPGDMTSLGLRYQRGRKDPFPTWRQSNRDWAPNFELHDDYEYKSDLWFGSSVCKPAEQPLEYSIANPMILLSDLIDTNPWTGPDDNKSIYDPCPSGWRVPVDPYYLYEYYRLSEYDRENIGILAQCGYSNYIWFPFSQIVEPYDNNHVMDSMYEFGWYHCYDCFLDIGSAEGYNKCNWDDYSHPTALPVRCMKD